nr:EOG090X0CBU [Eulimnadia texana]
MENVTSMTESDFGFECFQNFSAPEVFIQGLAGLVDQRDVEEVVRAQKQMLQRFEKTNEMLVNCNSLSQAHFAKASQELKRHVELLVSVKRDLDNIFKRVRVLKGRVKSQYPEAYKQASSQVKPLPVEEEVEDTAENAASIN